MLWTLLETVNNPKHPKMDLFILLPWPVRNCPQTLDTRLTSTHTNMLISLFVLFFSLWCGDFGWQQQFGVQTKSWVKAGSERCHHIEAQNLEKLRDAAAGGGKGRTRPPSGVRQRKAAAAVQTRCSCLLTDAERSWHIYIDSNIAENLICRVGVIYPW